MLQTRVNYCILCGVYSMPELSERNFYDGLKMKVYITSGWDTARYGLFMHFCDSNHEVTQMQQGQIQ